MRNIIIRIIWLQEGEKSGRKKFKEIVVENFKNLMKGLDIQFHGTKNTLLFPCKRLYPRCIIMKLSKIMMKKILKATREKRK